MSRGLFVTFEGGEGAGKTTLIRRLEKELNQRNHSTLVTREPGGTPLGEQIRLLVLKQHEGVQISPRAELLLFLAARAQHLDDVIHPALHTGKIVLCDRFNDSSVAYQGIARGLGQEAVQKLCKATCEALEPDLTFYLDLEPAVGMQRAHNAKRALDRLESEESLFHEKVRQGFLKLAAENPKRIVVVDAGQTPDRVFRFVLNVLSEHV